MSSSERCAELRRQIEAECISIELMDKERADRGVYLNSYGDEVPLTEKPARKAVFQKVLIEDSDTAEDTEAVEEETKVPVEEKKNKPRLIITNRAKDIPKDEKKPQARGKVEDFEGDPDSAPPTESGSFTHYVFTVHESRHPDWYLDKINTKEVTYIIAGREICPKTGGVHYQCYAEFKGKPRPKAAQALVGAYPCWMKRREGSQEQARHYCLKPVPGCSCKHCLKAIKDGQLVNDADEWGVLSTNQQGKRSDLEAVVELVRQKKTYREIADICPVACIKYSEGIRGLMSILNPPVMDKPEWHMPWMDDIFKIIEEGWKKRKIIWIWSKESETLKSTLLDWLVHKYGSLGCIKGNCWDMREILYNLDEHKTVLFDIPRTQYITKTMTTLLEDLSNGGLELSTKYKGRPVIPKVIPVVTANKDFPYGKLPGRGIVINTGAKIPVVLEHVYDKATHTGHLVEYFSRKPWGTENPDGKPSLADAMEHKLALGRARVLLENEAKRQRKADLKDAQVLLDVEMMQGNVGRQNVVPGLWSGPQINPGARPISGGVIYGVSGNNPETPAPPQSKAASPAPAAQFEPAAAPLRKKPVDLFDYSFI